MLKPHFCHAFFKMLILDGISECVIWAVLEYSVKIGRS